MKNKTILLTLLAVCLMLWSCDTKTKNVDSCGDGFVDPGEDCDGSQLNGATCTSLGFYKADGVLACNAQCRLDTTDCDTARCGDNLIQPEREDCESTDLGGKSCVSLGYERGTLSCNENCHFDLSGCESAGLCGDSIIQAPEQCDGTELNGQSCQNLGYYEGILACSSSCQFIMLNCQGQCGDGTVDTFHQEACDGTNLDAQTCVTRGFSQGSGALVCKADCTFDETACVPKSTNADLATLAVSSGTLTPVFSADTTSYELMTAVTTLTVTANAEDPWAVVAIAPAQPMALSMGDSSVTVTVTAESGAQKVYTIVITRLSPNDYISLNIGILKYVPGGTFQRDATQTNLSTVSAFRMSRTEITRAQWVAVTGWADPSNITYSSSTSDPVQMVSWYDAIAFCNKLSLLEGLTPVYTVSGVNFSTLTYAQIPLNNATWNAATVNWAANGYRLPTEMEWMWAAMGADSANPGAVNTTGYAKAFAGSTGTNAIGDFAVFGYSTLEVGRTANERSNPVSSKLPNELGVFDLSGNVFEWVWDWFATPFPQGTLTNYRGPVPADYRTNRGGNFGNPSIYCRMDNRNYNYPDTRSYGNGFRVVRN